MYSAITIRLPNDLFARLRRASGLTGQPMSRIVRLSLEKTLSQNLKNPLDEVCRRNQGWTIRPFISQGTFTHASRAGERQGRGEKAAFHEGLRDIQRAATFVLPQRLLARMRRCDSDSNKREAIPLLCPPKK